MKIKRMELWRPRLGGPELRVLDLALTTHLDGWEGPWNEDAVLAEELLERVRQARTQVEGDPKQRFRILEGGR
jgi:hypothetical protein